MRLIGNLIINDLANSESEYKDILWKDFIQLVTISLTGLYNSHNKLILTTNR